MSLSDFFKRIFNGIGKKFRDLMKKAKPFLHKEIPLVIALVNSLKFTVENGGDFLTAVIPGTWDDKIMAKAKDVLPKLLVELKLFDIAVNTDSNAEIYKAAIAYLQSIIKDKRKGKWAEIANYLIVALVDDDLSWAEIDHLRQIAYDEKISEAA